MKSKLIYLTIIVVAALMIIGILWVRSGVIVSIHNVGTQLLRSATVHVSGNSYSIGDIAIGDTKKVEVYPKYDSHIEIEHSDQRRIVVDCYMENGYKGTIALDVTAEQVVHKDDHTRAF